MLYHVLLLARRNPTISQHATTLSPHAHRRERVGQAVSPSVLSGGTIPLPFGTDYMLQGKEDGVQVFSLSRQQSMRLGVAPPPVEEDLMLPPCDDFIPDKLILPPTPVRANHASPPHRTHLRAARVTMSPRAAPTHLNSSTSPSLEHPMWMRDGQTNTYIPRADAGTSPYLPPRPDMVEAATSPSLHAPPRNIVHQSTSINTNYITRLYMRCCPPHHRRERLR